MILVLKEDRDQMLLTCFVSPSICKSVNITILYFYRILGPSSKGALSMMYNLHTHVYIVSSV